MALSKHLMSGEKLKQKDTQASILEFTVVVYSIICMYKGINVFVSACIHSQTLVYLHDMLVHVLRKVDQVSSPPQVSLLELIAEEEKEEVKRKEREFAQRPRMNEMCVRER